MQKTNYGLVSIVMPNYNSEKYLKATIESFLAQTYAINGQDAQEMIDKHNHCETYLKAE